MNDHGLTLVESLAATTLLAIIASVCAPMIVPAPRVEPSADRSAVRALREEVDSIMSDPKALRHLVRAVQTSHGRACQPGTAIGVRALTQRELDIPGGRWLVFERGSASVSRWVADGRWKGDAS